MTTSQWTYVGIVLFLSLSALAYWIRPGWLWRLPVGKLPFANLMRRLPRALDGWVEIRLEKPRSFIYAQAGPDHIDTPTTLNAAPLPRLTSRQLQPIFDRSPAMVLITGEAGSGKTRLAYELAKRAMFEAVAESVRLVRSHKMIPLVIEDDLFTSDEPPASWFDGARLELSRLLCEKVDPDLFAQLLKRQRILVIVDGLSEMGEEARKRFQREAASFPALVVTSRLPEEIPSPNRNDVEMGPIPTNRLSVFIDAYLIFHGQRERFSDEELVGSVSHLAKLAGGREVTSGLAKIYCDVMIALGRGTSSTPFPESIVELVESYRDTKVSRDRSRVVNELAWQCLSGTFRPRAATGEVTKDLQGLLRQSAVPEGNRFRFAIPLVAEYLAAIHISQVTGSNETAWHQLLESAAKADGAPASIRSFLRAARDVVHLRWQALEIPDFVPLELARFTGDAIEPIRTEIVRTRVSRILSDLTADFVRAHPDLAVDRIRTLMSYGPEVKQATPLLVDLARNPLRELRATAVEALGRIDPSELARALELQSRDAEVEAARIRLRAVLPTGPFAGRGIRIAHRWREATLLSGDFYQFIPRSDDSIGIYLVDVSGHGIPAAQQAQSVYEILANATDEAGWGGGLAREQLARADRLLGEKNLAVVMNFTEVDGVNKRIRHANAGMPPLLLYRAGEGLFELVQASGIYVGKGYNRYPSKRPSAEAEARDGDLLIFYSDGIVEARDTRGRIFGQKGITAAVAGARWGSSEEVADAIMSAVAAHTGLDQPEDDQTLVVAQFGDVIRDVVVGTSQTLAVLESEIGVIEFGLRNAPDSGASAYLRLFEILKAWAVPRLQYGDPRARQIWGATWEAIQNALRYGSGRGDVIRIRLEATDSELHVELRQPRNWPRWDLHFGQARRAEVLNPESVGIRLGGGSVLMIRLADDIEITSNGRSLKMVFKRASEPREPARKSRG